MGSRPVDVDALYRTHIHDLRRFARSLVKSDEEAEEIAHEAVIKLIRTSADAEVVRPRTLLFTAAYHVAIDRLRRRRFERTLFDAALPSEERLSDQPSAERTLEDREQLTAAFEALSAMKPLRRRVLMLNRLDGLSYREISRETGLSVNSVEKHVARAVSACRQFIAQRETISAVA